MIGTIRRHQKWLWLVIIAATIVSFVYMFSPANRNNISLRDSGGYSFGAINGEPITREQMRDAALEARIFLRLNSSVWPDQSRDKDINNIARQRLMLDAEIEEHHIVATPEATARYVRQLLGVKPEDNVPADKIMETLNKIAQEGGVSADDFYRFARHQVGQEYLVALVGMSGKLITPQEVEVFFTRENEPIETELVTFPATNYYASTAPTEAQITDYYTKEQANYRLPDRIQVNYIEFPASNYQAKVEKDLGTNLNDHIDQLYTRDGAAAFKDEAGVQLSPDAAKARIKKNVILYNALTEARKDAGTFLNELSQGHDDTHPYTVGDMAALAKSKNLTVKTTAPFDPNDPPAGLKVPAKNLRVLFSLRDDDPDDHDRSMLYDSSPLIGEDAVYVAGLQKRIPSQIQSLSEVHDKVIRDYRRDKSLELAKDAGGRFQSALEAGLSQGKTFDTMCAAQFVHPLKLTPFSLTTRSIPDVPDQGEFEKIANLAGRMQTGQCSGFNPTDDGGFLLYVKGRQPVDPAVLQRELPGFVQQMRDKLQIAAFEEWFGRQFRAGFRAPAGENDLSAAGG